MILLVLHAHNDVLPQSKQLKDLPDFDFGCVKQWLNQGTRSRLWEPMDPVQMKDWLASQGRQWIQKGLWATGWTFTRQGSNESFQEFAANHKIQ